MMQPAPHDEPSLAVSDNLKQPELGMSSVSAPGRKPTDKLHQRMARHVLLAGRLMVSINTRHCR